MDLREKYMGFSKLSISEQGDSASITPVSGDGATEALCTVFSDYPNIKKLTFENTPADMSVLESLKDLETLILPHDYMNYGDGHTTSNVRDISALKHLTNLAAVSIGSNVVIDYSPIRCLPGYKKDWEGGALVWHGVPSDMLRWFKR